MSQPVAESTAASLTSPTSAFGQLAHLPAVPLDPAVGVYDVRFGFAYPTEYSTWKDEVLSWKTSAYLHGGLNPTQTYRIHGPDALRLLSEHCVNSMANFRVGTSKHAIMCDDEGRVMVHGVLVRRGEDDFYTYWLMPWINYLAEELDYDVQVEDLTGKVYLFQLAGPRSLEIIESASKTDLRDVKFLHERRVRIGETDTEVHPVEVLRIGMAGSLAYELHGPIEDAHRVYNALLGAGKEFGLRRLGREQYNMNHTENGFPQEHVHFIHPWFEHEGLVRYLQAKRPGARLPHPSLYGSAGDDPQLRYRNPLELGWGHVVKFDHEFQGRAALERLAAEPERVMRTLVWNAEDVLDVYRSHLEQGEEYKFMRFQGEPLNREVVAANFSDVVLKDGVTVGVSSGRIYSYYYRQMISLVSIDVAQAELGTEVVVLWGEPGTRQKEIRATVQRFPFYDENRNEKIDTSIIPLPSGVEK
ncbi:MAG TPA: hypothetical protein VNT53_06410 [Pseudolysinimonas sp.]|nr:hypothetical protein [Pseudolysinimonas sp.]